ncbi:type II toxin-antitoxin system PemK/MazF family toxin [Methanolobus sp. ZRKC5]|uniref:type II toxin-antitoxin system PemK/MazF family toxin n=1 Tax=unclassified Methanolobus TaxID=2629569 RepID=UPI00313ED578
MNEHSNSLRTSKGTVVILPFPFSDLTASKKRPALVIVDLAGEDVILCQITSNHRLDGYEVPLRKDDFADGHLKVDSLIRTNKLFTATKDIIIAEVGKVTDAKIKDVDEKLIAMIKAGQ